MLNQTARSLTSERIVDQRAQGTPKGPLSLSCATCGKKVEMPFWQPQASCGHCGALGYPDRALRNLLPLGWDCPACGEANDGRANFCLSCGAGLASRCQRCESPVYGPICLQCGEHQARPLHLMKGQSERVDWLPVQRERIERQVAHLRSLEASQEAVAAPVLPPRPSRPMSRSEQKAVERAERKAMRQSRRKSGGWGFNWWTTMMVIGGLYWMFGRSGAKEALTSAPDAAPVVSSAWTSIQAWVGSVAPSLGQISTLTPGDPEYAYMFAVILAGLVAVPFGLYLIDRAIKRFFP